MPLEADHVQICIYKYIWVVINIENQPIKKLKQPSKYSRLSRLALLARTEKKHWVFPFLSAVSAGRLPVLFLRAVGQAALVVQRRLRTLAGHGNGLAAKAAPREGGGMRSAFLARFREVAASAVGNEPRTQSTDVNRQNMTSKP